MMHTPDPSQPPPPLFDRENPGQLLRTMGGISLLLTLIVGVSAFAQHDVSPIHGLTALGVCIALCAGLLGFRRHPDRLPSRGVLWGAWLIILIGAAFTGGNRTTSLSAIPVLIVLVGWLFGMRHALLMTAVSILALLGMSLSEQYDWLPMGGSSPPLSRWMVLSNVLLLTAFLTLHSRRLYLSRYQALHRLSATLGLLTEGTPIMLAAVDGRGCYSYVNQNYAHFHGLAPTALRGSLVDAVLGDGIQQHNLARLDAGGGSATFRSRRHNRQTGDERWIETCLRSATATDGRTDGYYALLRDITDEVRTEEEIRFLAYHDALTGLPNRILLADRLRQAIARAARDDTLVAVCYLDLDRFKFFNDTWGHTVGDEILVQVAGRLRDSLRGSDTVARLGGDEFLVLIGGIADRQEMPAALARLLGTVSQPVVLEDGAEIRISASAGVALFPRDGEEPDVLLRHADQAMLLAKQSGRARYALFDTELEQRNHHLQRIVSSVDRGLDGGQFRLFFQPKVNLRLSSVIGAEALIRWEHPDEGLLLPDAFLPWLESSPVGVRLDRWVLAAALDQMSRWHAAGLDIPVSINVSGHHLLAPDFVDHLTAQLIAHPSVAPERLELEILETTAMEDVDQVARVIRACTALGVSFALDDFGTGYSSLTYFRRLPARTLKIDRSFVRDILADPEDLAIVKGVVALARSFGRQVIAEGVETPEHCGPLLSLGCDCVQGYGIGHPMPAAEFPGWVRTWKSVNG